MAHYIRTIHTSFTSGTPSSSSSSSSSSAWASSTPYATTSASAHANILVNLGGIMNKYPPGLGHSEWRNLASGSSNAPPYTRRRNSISLRAPTSRRAAPPPPAVSRVQPASLTHMKFDPFSDENSPLDTVLYHTPAPPRSYSTAPRTHTVQIPHVDRDKDARSRLVAGILLNRVHAVGKPMRGRRPSTAPKEYVRSGLSRVVSVEA